MNEQQTAEKSQRADAAPNQIKYRRPNITTAKSKRSLSRGSSIALLVSLGVVAIVIFGSITAALFLPSILNARSKAEVISSEQSYSVPSAREHRGGSVDYATIPPYITPPVGGPHNTGWQNCGIYDRPIPTEGAMHSLEHGAVWITYLPNVQPITLINLQALARRNSYVLLSPYPGQSAPIIASALGNKGATGYQVRLQPDQTSDLDRFIVKHANASDAAEGGSCSGGQGSPLR